MKEEIDLQFWFINSTYGSTQFDTDTISITADILSVSVKIEFVKQIFTYYAQSLRAYKAQYDSSRSGSVNCDIWDISV
jgi:hypothetical protein